MAVHVIKKGLDLPITGAPEQRVFDAPAVSKVAILARDYPIVQGGTLVIAIIFVGVNLLVDVSYAFLDPRIHYD